MHNSYFPPLEYQKFDNNTLNACLHYREISFENLFRSKVAAEEGAALESAMSALSKRIATDNSLRAAAEKQAADHLAAFQEAQSEVAELKAQAELMAAEREELAEEHKLALGAAELDVEEAERAQAESQELLDTIQTEHAEAVELTVTQESTVSELSEQLRSATASQEAVEEEAQAHLERATLAEQVCCAIFP